MLTGAGPGLKAVSSLLVSWSGGPRHLLVLSMCVAVREGLFSIQEMGRLQTHPHTLTHDPLFVSG